MRFFGKSKPEEQQPISSERVVKSNEEKKKTAKPPVFNSKPKDPKTPEPDVEKQTSARIFNRFQKKSTESERAKKAFVPKTVIGKTVVVSGEISGGEEVLVEGHIEGDIYILSKLSIGISGSVDGKIEAQEIRIAGKANGEINASNKIEIATTGDVIGQMNTPRIIVLEGASMKGNIKTTKAKRKVIDTSMPTPTLKKTGQPLPGMNSKQPLLKEKENIREVTAGTTTMNDVQTPAPDAVKPVKNKKEKQSGT